MLFEEVDCSALEPMGEDWYTRFTEKRNTLIERLEQGKITKREFILNNILAFSSSNQRPFFSANTLEKLFFNYQYYNSMAKYHKMLAEDFKKSNKKRRYNHEMNLSWNYYKEKDQTILDILKCLEYKDISSYYIHCCSKKLDRKLFEIVLLKESNMILHSKNNEIYQILKNHALFQDEIRPSLIDHYINNRY